MKWFILFLGIACNASVSVLVKIEMMPPRKFPSFSDPVASLSKWPLWLGMVMAQRSCWIQQTWPVSLSLWRIRCLLAVQ